MRDEARLLGLLRHRAIVQAEDLITLAGRTAVVMEYIPGVNHSWIIHPKRYEDSIPPRVILTIIGHIADALDAAYNRPSTVTGKPLQVLHRDIKPGNVRVTPDGEVKVLDFGIARSDHMEREASTTEYQLGSLPYMSPELMAGKGASTASDVYSLGVTFYESLGRRRFGWAGEDQEAHGRQIDTRVGDIDWTSFGDAASETETLLRSMLAFDPRERPSARKVLERTRELEHNSPGDSLETWAPKALEKVQDPEEEKSETGELIGQTLFEEVSTSAFDKQDLLDQLDEATMALSEQELRQVRDSIETTADAKKTTGSIRDKIVLLILLVAAGATAYVSFFIEKTDPQAPRQGQRANLTVTTAEPEETTQGSSSEEDSEVATAVEAEASGQLPEPTAETSTADQEETVRPTPKAERQPTASRPIQTPVASPVTAAPPVDETPVAVRINSAPFGIPVLIDGKPAGRTPIQNLPLTPGTHVLLFQDGENSIRHEILVTPDGKSSWKYIQTERKVR